MTDTITHAAVGGPPDDWQDLQVRDLDSGQLVEAVEVDTEEGWVKVYDRAARQLVGRGVKPGPTPTKTIKGRFAIERQPDK
jgi:hypothetical protein